jgi:hypothetical protein
MPESQVGILQVQRSPAHACQACAHITGVGLLGVLFGGIIGWAAARRVDEQRARREAYAKYLAAVDEVTGRLARRMLGIRHHMTPLKPAPDHQPARLAFTSLLILASPQMVELANRLQALGNDLGRMSATRSFAEGTESEWEAATTRDSEVRRTYINRARVEVGAGVLPGSLFDSD